MLFAQGIFSRTALILLASQLTVLPIGFGDGQLKRIAVVALDFVNRRSI